MSASIRSRLDPLAIPHKDSPAPQLLLQQPLDQKSSDVRAFKPIEDVSRHTPQVSLPQRPSSGNYTSRPSVESAKADEHHDTDVDKAAHVLAGMQRTFSNSTKRSSAAPNSAASNAAAPNAAAPNSPAPNSAQTGRSSIVAQEMMAEYMIDFPEDVTPSDGQPMRAVEADQHGQIGNDSSDEVSPKNQANHASRRKRSSEVQSEGHPDESAYVNILQDMQSHDAMLGEAHRKLQSVPSGPGYARATTYQDYGRLPSVSSGPGHGRTERLPSMSELGINYPTAAASTVPSRHGYDAFSSNGYRPHHAYGSVESQPLAAYGLSTPATGHLPAFATPTYATRGASGRYASTFGYPEYRDNIADTWSTRLPAATPAMAGSGYSQHGYGPAPRSCSGFYQRHNARYAPYPSYGYNRSSGSSTSGAALAKPQDDAHEDQTICEQSMIDDNTPCETATEGAPVRKCVSHFFGRNKACTRSIIDEAWLTMCRKHYQRIKYKASKDNMFPVTQHRWLVFNLNKFDRYMGDAVWEIQWISSVRKLKNTSPLEVAEEKKLDYYLALELDPMTGKNKSTNDVRAFVEAMIQQFHRRRNAGEIYNELPKIEFLLQTFTPLRRRR